MHAKLRQMQKMQMQMQAAQMQLTATEFVRKSASAMEPVKFSGAMLKLHIQIKPVPIAPEAPDMLQDQLIVPVNQAMADIACQTQDKLGC